MGRMFAVSSAHLSGKTTIALCTVAILLFGNTAHAGLTEESRTLAGGGGWTSNQVAQTFSVVGSLAPGGFTRNSSFINQAGFASSVVLQPLVDTDTDGVIDENDPDDDGDGMEDATELAGSSFDPVTPTAPLAADSDSDGTTDGDEAVAGTNPHDAAARLRITDLQPQGGDVVLTWQSRDGYQYDLLGATSVTALAVAPSVVDCHTAAGGTAPWYEVLSVATNTPGGPTLFYRVEVVGSP